MFKIGAFKEENCLNTLAWNDEVGLYDQFYFVGLGFPLHVPCVKGYLMYTTFTYSNFKQDSFRNNIQILNKTVLEITFKF